MIDIVRSHSTNIDKSDDDLDESKNERIRLMKTRSSYSIGTFTNKMSCFGMLIGAILNEEKAK